MIRVSGRSFIGDSDESSTRENGSSTLARYSFVFAGPLCSGPTKSGPQPYVGSIYRHAGIPVKARSSFCRMLAALIRNGFAFTRTDFDLAVENLASPVTKQFLRSRAGYDFARNTAYIVERLFFNRLPYEEIQSVPAYRRSICEGVLELLRESPHRESRAPVSYSAPVIALDRDNSRLVLRFDERGVQVHAYRTPSGLVLYSTVSLSRSSPAQYRIVPDLDWQTVDPWWVPGRSAEALFSFGDGALVDTSRIRSGPECTI